MKWYFSSRTRHRQLIKRITRLLKSQGDRVVFDWASLPLLEPYKNNQKKSSEVADKIGKAIKEADIFVLISDPEGTDMFVELGMAIIYAGSNKKMRIYAIGKDNKRSLMCLHPKIIHLDNLEELFEKERPEILDKIRQNYEKSER